MKALGFLLITSLRIETYPHELNQGKFSLQRDYWKVWKFKVENLKLLYKPRYHKQHDKFKSFAKLEKRLRELNLVL